MSLLGLRSNSWTALPLHVIRGKSFSGVDMWWIFNTHSFSRISYIILCPKMWIQTNSYDTGKSFSENFFDYYYIRKSGGKNTQQDFCVKFKYFVEIVTSKSKKTWKIFWTDWLIKIVKIGMLHHKYFDPVVVSLSCIICGTF